MSPCFSILLGMKRARLQSGQLQPAQPLADGSLVYRYGEPLGHLAPQVEASPAHHLVGLGIGAFDHQCLQIIHLRLVESRRSARATARRQARDPGGIVAMHPIAQRLAIHAGQLRRFNARPALQDQGDGQQAPNLSAIAALCCELAQCLSRMLRPCDRDCLAQLILLAANRRRENELQSAAIGNPPRESGFSAAGITSIHSCVLRLDNQERFLAWLGNRRPDATFSGAKLDITGAKVARPK